MKNYTYEQYLEDQEIADSLDFWQNRMHVPYETAAKVCNGIGPSWFPEKIRSLVDKLNPKLIPVANNHDLGFYYGSLTKNDFHRVNDAFRVNGEKVADDEWRKAKKECKWYQAKLYLKYWECHRIRRQAAVFAALCDTDLGWPAYAAAVNERKENERKSKEEARDAD